MNDNLIIRSGLEIHCVALNTYPVPNMYSHKQISL